MAMPNGGWKPQRLLRMLNAPYSAEIFARFTTSP